MSLARGSRRKKRSPWIVKDVAPKPKNGYIKYVPRSRQSKYSSMFISKSIIGNWIWLFHVRHHFARQSGSFLLKANF